MRKEPLKIAKELYFDPIKVVQFVNSKSTEIDHKTFIDLMEKNHFVEMNLLCGYEELDDSCPFLMLKSGKMVTSTATWNPLVFGMIFNHKLIV